MEGCPCKRKLYLLLNWHRFRNIRIAWFLSQCWSFFPLARAFHYDEMAQKGHLVVGFRPCHYGIITTLYWFVSPFAISRVVLLYLNFGAHCFFILGNCFLLQKRKERWCFSKESASSIQVLSRKKNEILCWVLVNWSRRKKSTFNLSKCYPNVLLTITDQCAPAPVFVAGLWWGITKSSSDVYLSWHTCYLIFSGLNKAYYVEDVKEQWEKWQYIVGERQQGMWCCLHPMYKDGNRIPLTGIIEAAARCGISSLLRNDTAAVADALRELHFKPWALLVGHRGSSGSLEPFKAFFLNASVRYGPDKRGAVYRYIVYLFKLTKQWWLLRSPLCRF